VVLVLTDDQGYGDFSVHGNSVLETPHIDSLHAESARLVDFHVDPSCAPTRAALLTGRYSARAGVWDTSSGRQILRRDEITVADVFRKNGYRTAIFGKLHLGHNYPYLPENRGFDESLVHYSGGIGQGPDYWGNDYFDDTYFRAGTPEKVSGYCADIWFGEGLRFIEENKERPFFLYVSTNTPHGPYRVPEKYSRPFIEKGVPEPRASFYGMCVNIDDHVGALRLRLQELGLEKNTIFIFMTDNGGTAGLELSEKYHGWVVSGYNAGMRGGKQSMYEGGHRVPCFVRWPSGGIGGPAGHDVEPLTAHFDLMPTLIDLCGLTPPTGLRFDGKSLAPLLRAADAEWPDRKLVAAVHREQFPPRWYRTAVLTERWRLIGGDELYDMEQDFAQRNDVALEHPEVLADLRAFYREHYRDVSTKFGEFSHLVIGAPEANPTYLTSHDLLEDDKVLAVDVVRAGSYEITLADQRPVQKIPLGIQAVRVQLGDVEVQQTVAPDSHRVVLSARLVAGEQFLKTWLTDARTGVLRDAKFVSFRYLGP